MSARPAAIVAALTGVALVAGAVVANATGLALTVLRVRLRHAPIARLVGTGTSTSATAFRNVSSGQSRTLHLAIGDAGTAEVMACP